MQIVSPEYISAINLRLHNMVQQYRSHSEKLLFFLSRHTNFVTFSKVLIRDVCWKLFFCLLLSNAHIALKYIKGSGPNSPEIYLKQWAIRCNVPLMLLDACGYLHSSTDYRRLLGPNIEPSLLQITARVR